jgi:hypothetical protein
MSKESKNTKAKKVEEIEEVEEEVKTEKTNALTKKAGLSFNVNTFKRWMISYFENNELEKPKFSGSHVAVSALTESLVTVIISAAKKQITKGTSGLYDIHRGFIISAIQLNPELRDTFISYLHTFDPTMNYGDQLCIDYKTVVNYLESHEGGNIQFQQIAYNCLSYFVVKFISQVLRTAHACVQYSKRKTLDPRSIITAVNIHTTGTLNNALRMRIEEALRNIGSTLDGDDDALEADGEEDDKKETKKSQEKEELVEEEKPEEPEEHEEEEEKEVVHVKTKKDKKGKATQEEEEPAEPKKKPRSKASSSK